VYDSQVDCAYITLAKPISTTVCEEVGSGIILEYDATQTIIGIELLGVKTLSQYDLELLSSRIDNKIYVNLLRLLTENKIDRFHTFL
jgi:uncharacterized protein YuzE